VQGTYETFAELLRRHYGGKPRGQMDPHRRPRRHGRRAAARRHHGGRSLLAIECQPSRIEMRLKTGYLDAQAKDLDEALAMMERAEPRAKADLGRRARQRRRDAARAGAARREARRGHRPDLGA
jgi:urocanate hydratase